MKSFQLFVALIACNLFLIITGFHIISKNYLKLSNQRNNLLIPLNAIKKHKVTINHEGENNFLEISENESILEAALDAGIRLPHDCKMGVCLRCSAKVKSGIFVI